MVEARGEASTGRPGLPVGVDQTGTPRELENLRHLARAYEHLLNKGAGEEVVPTDERRPEILGRLLGTSPPEAYATVQALA